MDKSNFRMGYPAIAAWVAAEHPNKPTPCRKPARVPAPPGYWEERRALDVPPKAPEVARAESCKTAEDTDGWTSWAPGEPAPDLSNAVRLEVRSRRGSTWGYSTACMRTSPNWGVSSETVCYRIIKEQPKPDADGWIAWKPEDGQPKLARKTRIEIQCGDKFIFRELWRDVASTNWEECSAITAYRVIEA